MCDGRKSFTCLLRPLVPDLLGFDCQTRSSSPIVRCRSVAGIISVPLRPAIVERSAIVRIEGEVMTQPFRKIRIREKVPAKRDEVGIALRKNCLGARCVKAAGSDHRPSKQRAKRAGG